MADRICTMDGCETKEFARGWCHKHWDRWRRHGDPHYAAEAHGALAERFWRKVDCRGADECWEWTASRSPRGYGRIGADRGRGSPVLLAPRVSWELHNGPIPESLHVLHSCDNPPCVNPAHLFLGTNADNIADRVAKGRSHRALAKLTETDVRAIRASSDRASALALRYGVAPRTIRDARDRKTWVHVQ